MDVKTIIAKCGGPTKLAAHLGIKHPSVVGWKRVPIAHVRAIAKLTGLALHQIAPEVYDPPEAGGATRDEAA